MTSAVELIIKTKRVYDQPAPSDGCRILVDRLWPRGLSRKDAAIDAWIKDAAPSRELRKWFGHDPSRWETFEREYFAELDQRGDIVREIVAVCSGTTVSLLFAAKDPDHNNAVALKEYLERQLRPTERTD